MNNIDRQYTELLLDIIHFGVDKSDRTGTGTKSIFGRQIRHKMNEGFPLLTTKKMAWKTMVTELLWFLRGDTNIKFLVDNDCHIWDGDAYKNYLNYPLATIQDHRTNVLYKNIDKGWCVLNGRSFASPHPTRHLTKEEFINKIKTDDEFAKKWGELGPVYGKQWRKWTKKKMYLSTDGSYENIYDEMDQTVIDQITNLINELKTNPDSRRLMVSAWNVGELDQMVLPPCHYGFQMYTRELTGEERWELLKQTVGEERFKSMVDDIMPFGGGLSEDLQSYNIPKRAISLMFNMRSTDVGLGLGFNLASYGLLLMMIAKQVNMIPGELVYNGGDVHLYSNHIEPIKEQLTRQPYELPTVKLSDRVVNDISEYTLDDIILENYQSHPSIKMPLSN